MPTYEMDVMICCKVQVDADCPDEANYTVNYNLGDEMNRTLAGVEVTEVSIDPDSIRPLPPPHWRTRS